MSGVGWLMSSPVKAFRVQKEALWLLLVKCSGGEQPVEMKEARLVGNGGAKNQR